MSKPGEMWQCQFTNCGYIYDPARGDKKGKMCRVPDMIRPAFSFLSCPDATGRLVRSSAGHPAAPPNQ